MEKIQLHLTCTCIATSRMFYLTMVLCTAFGFSYERYNGILETQPTNEVEIQLMQRFISDNNSYLQPAKYF